jgi:phosphoribosylformimino-5-aminoimidazole carboxamide ribotide isomerase
MILIPQIYLKEGRAIEPEKTAFSLFDTDAYAMAKAMMAVGTDAVYLTDLNVATVGQSPNLQIISKIKKDLKIKVYVTGPFRAKQSFPPYIEAGVDLIVLDTHAYQQPQIVEDACELAPKSVAVNIDVRDGRVTIPGWTVAANKTTFDYAERFGNQGVTVFFYSNTKADGTTTKENLNELQDFCKKVRASVFCTNEVTSLQDVQNLVTLGAPGLVGYILGRGLYQGKIDLRGANALVADMMLDSSNEPTLQEL